MRARVLFLTPFAMAALAAPAPAAVTAEADAAKVAAALTDGTTTTVTGASWVSRPTSGQPSAVGDSAVLGFPNGGANYAVLSDGTADVLLSGPQSTGASTGNGGAGRGNSDHDTLVLKVDLDVPAGANCLSFAFRFLSDEYPSFVGKQYNDAFIAELDKDTWTTSDSAITAPDNFAFDPAGAVISINATGATTVKAEEAAGTVFNGGTPLLYAVSPVTGGAHSLYLSIFDQGDNIFDSAVMLDNLVVGTAAADGCKPGASTAPPVTTAPAANPGTGTTTQPKVNVPGPPKTVFGAGGAVSAPSNKACLSKRNFTIRIKKRAGTTYVAAFVWVNGTKVVTRKGNARVTAPIDLRGLPRGTYKVKIRVVTDDGSVITGTRTYRTCTKKRVSKGPRL